MELCHRRIPDVNCLLISSCQLTCPPEGEKPVSCLFFPLPADFKCKQQQIFCFFSYNKLLTKIKTTPFEKKENTDQNLFSYLTETNLHIYCKWTHKAIGVLSEKSLQDYHETMPVRQSRLVSS